jgi:SpoIIAA-like
MPMGFCIYPDFRLLFIRGHGVVTQAERVETMLTWLRDPLYERCTDALFDVTTAESTPKVAELRQIIALLRQHQPAGGPRKLAIVTAKPITFVVAGIFEELIQFKAVPLRVKVFLNREQAWTWLRPGEPLPDPR